jgi:hypothetical protein
LTGTASAYLWFTASPPPAIANLSPSSGPVGTPVTLTGIDFGTTQGTSTVTFNGTSATPSSWSSGSIAAPVPAGATTGPVVVSVGGVNSNGVNFTVTSGTFNPTKLVVTSVNSGNNPTAGAGFPVVVQAQDATGVPRNVAVNTGVSLSLKTGTGTIGGTLTGTIAAGTNQAMISGVTYTKAESGVVITATRTSGDTLTSGDSAAFAVNPGTATKLAFTTQPGSVTAGSAITGPPTVTVQDAFGNTVTSSAASITVAIGNNPGGGVLSGTATRNASSGVAAFGGLSINQGGNGYTLTVSSSGLTGSTSDAFNVTSVGVGTIAGVIIGVSSGLPIDGALVELLQANAVTGLLRTPANGSYSFSSLPVGSYDVRASAPDFAAEEQMGVSVTSGGTSTVNFSLVSVPGLRIDITSPADDKVVERENIWLRGQLNAPAGVAQVTVNGEPTVVNVGNFGAFVPVDLGASAVSAILIDLAGNVAIDTIIVTRQQPTAPDFFGLWDGLKDALRVGNVTAALEFIVERSRERYQGIFNALGTQVTEIDQILTDITVIAVRQNDAEFEMMRDGRSFFIHFTKDDDGIWRIAGL